MNLLLGGLAGGGEGDGGVECGCARYGGVAGSGMGMGTG